MLTQEEKEQAYMRKFSIQFDRRFPTPIRSAKSAMRWFAGHLLDKPERLRSVPRRGYLAALKGGRCEMDVLIQKRPELASLPLCNNVIHDYRFLTLWEFNHVVPRATDDRQFVISGSSVCRRSWHVVKTHCLNDTVLLCRECHQSVTRLDKVAQIFANRIIYGAPE